MRLTCPTGPSSALLIEPGERATDVRPLAAPAAGVRPGDPRSARILSSSRPRPLRCWSIPRRPAHHGWDMTPRSPARSRPPLLPDAPVAIAVLPAPERVTASSFKVGRSGRLGRTGRSGGQRDTRSVPGVLSSPWRVNPLGDVPRPL